MNERITTERRDSDIATVTINRAERMNAMTRDMWLRLTDEVRALSGDDTVRCVVIRGAGEKAFCPGADIREFHDQRRTTAQARAYGEIVRDTIHAIRDCRHPTVAMIHGACTGGGLEIAVHCDLRLSGASGRFGIPINRIGVVLAYPELRGLVELAGHAVAREILLEGRVLQAGEALAKGLVTRVVPDGALETEVHDTAQRIAAGAPISNRWHKRFIARLMEDRPLSEEEFNEPYTAVESEDYEIGYQAFLAKKTPDFRGR